MVMVLVFLHSLRMVQWYWGPLKPVVREQQSASGTVPGVLLVVLGLGPLSQILRVVRVAWSTGVGVSLIRGRRPHVLGLDYNLCCQVVG